MKIRLADYVANFLVEHGVTDVFSVVGGGAMHLNDALGHHEGLKVTYNHHEQACAIAAESYARLENRIAAVCVTTGPGGTNALTGVLGGWLDSIPMFIISGQVRYDTTARFVESVTGMRPRAVGDQEYDIVRSVEPMTKYATMIEDVSQIRYALEKAWHLATTGRPGPVWIDVPVNFQGMEIETDELVGYEPEDAIKEHDCSVNAFCKIDGINEYKSFYHSDDAKDGRTEDSRDVLLPPPVSEELVRLVVEKIRAAKRPVFHAGYGIRLSGAYEVFRQVADKLGIPIVTYWNAIDLIEDEHPLYVGRAGNMGDRPGNWAIQNADLILAVGTRISIRQVGYNWKTWAGKAEVIMVDIDEAELKKPTLHVEMPIWADAKDFLTCMNRVLEEFEGDPQKRCNSLVKDERTTTSDNLFRGLDGNNGVSGRSVFSGDAWINRCRSWREKYPVVQPKHWEENGSTANVYAFMKYLSSRLPEKSLTVASNGACCVVGTQSFVIKKGSRFHVNSAVASMGYGLPAAIGACISAGRRETICLEGDGSIMMNIQELQTIITNRLPVKIFLINNRGYHSIRLTQNNLFAEHSKVGIGEESGDLSFPEFDKIAGAFGYRYYSAHSNAEMMKVVDEVLEAKGAVFCEIFTDTKQVWEPKSSTKRLPDGTLVSPPLEDLAPFLPREELDEIMRD